MKEKTWCLISYMLDCGIKYLHNQIVIHMVYNVCIWLNEFLLKSGLSMEYSSREIVTQCFVNYKKYCRAEFGSYVESGIDAMVTNGQNP